jgi:MFS family permease
MTQSEPAPSNPVPPKPLAWLSRDVMGLALNRFFSDLGHEAGTAILPLFLTAIGAPPFALGAIEAVSDGLSSFTKLYGGWLGDRVNRRLPWAALGYAMTGITTGLYGLAAAWPVVLIFRAIGWAGRGLRSPLHDAILTDAVPPAARGRAFGLDEAADTLGAIGGPLLALALVSFFAKSETLVIAYDQVFWLAAIPGLLSAALILVLVRESKHRQANQMTLRGSMNSLPAPFRRYLVGIGIFGLGDFSHTLLILRATQLLTASRGAQAGLIAIQLYALHNVLYAAGAYPVGALADRFGKRGLLVAAYVLAAVMDILLIATNSSASVAVLAIIFGVGGAVYASQQSLERALAADMLPEQVRSTGFGVLATVNGVGDFVSSLVVGLLWSVFAPAIGFAYSLVLSLAGAVAIFIALRSPSKTNDKGLTQA